MRQMRPTSQTQPTMGEGPLPGPHPLVARTLLLVRRIRETAVTVHKCPNAGPNASDCTDAEAVHNGSHLPPLHEGETWPEYWLRYGARQRAK